MKFKEKYIIYAKDNYYIIASNNRTYKIYSSAYSINSNLITISHQFIDNNFNILTTIFNI
jgi:hypothetical protein